MEENNVENVEVQNNIEPTKKNRGVKWLIIAIVALLLVVAGLLCYKVFVLDKKKDEPKKEVEKETKEYKSNYRMSGNSLEDFDLYFMQLENNNKNMVYSPMSIKYALSMLKEGTSGDSKAQIEAVVGDYISKKYINSNNLSLANSLFIRDTYKDSVKTTYIDALKDKYNAEVIYDSFTNADNINKWVSDKTFNLIPNLLDSVDDLQLVLTNALAIDMEWVKVIQATEIFNSYGVSFNHEKFSEGIRSLSLEGYSALNFDGYDKAAKSVEIGAVANKYDIVTELGEDNIRKTIKEEYDKWLDTGCMEANNNVEYCNTMSEEYDIDTYIEEINKNYKHISSSTDFEFYIDEDVKMFAKDLKEYDGSTLQYIGIMPTNEKLSEFIKNVDSKKLSNYINNLKGIDLDSFEDKTITYLYGFIPMFNFDYELDLIEDLKTLGINDVFDLDKADLSNITDSKLYIGDAAHKANIEFSNEGIKAAAVTNMGGLGATGPRDFDYDYEVPVKKIDLTFDKPYMFIIRDKDTGEVWFAGSVYTPTAISCNDVNMDISDWYNDDCIFE